MCIRDSTRSALQNAASIAGMVLTTEALVAEKPEKKEAPMPGGAPGMGGMGGMYSNRCVRRPALAR